MIGSILMFFALFLFVAAPGIGLMVSGAMGERDRKRRMEGRPRR